MGVGGGEWKAHEGRRWAMDGGDGEDGVYGNCGRAPVTRWAVPMAIMVGGWDFGRVGGRRRAPPHLPRLPVLPSTVRQRLPVCCTSSAPACPLCHPASRHIPLSQRGLATRADLNLLPCRPTLCERCRWKQLSLSAARLLRVGALTDSSGCVRVGSQRFQSVSVKAPMDNVATVSKARRPTSGRPYLRVHMLVNWVIFGSAG